MILLCIIFVSFLQLLLYYLIDKHKLKFPKILIFVLVLIGYYVVFPQYFMPSPKINHINCGMPTLGVFLGFWIFGTIAALMTHIIWMIKLYKKYKNQSY